MLVDEQEGGEAAIVERGLRIRSWWERRVATLVIIRWVGCLL